MTNDHLFLTGLCLGAVGFTAGFGMLFWDGAWRRYQASKRRKADRGWVTHV